MQGTGSFYGVVTFVVLAGAFLGLSHALWGWNFPSENRYQTSVTLMYFLAVGWFSMKVGKERDVPYLRAVGRALKGMVMR